MAFRFCSKRCIRPFIPSALWLAGLVPSCHCVAHITRSRGHNIKQVWKCRSVYNSSRQVRITLLTCSYLTSFGDCNEHRFGHDSGVLSQTVEICPRQQNPAKNPVVWAWLKNKTIQNCKNINNWIQLMQDKTKAEFKMAEINTSMLFWIMLKFVFSCM